MGLQSRMWANCPQNQSVGSTLSASPIYRQLLRPEYRLLGESATRLYFLGHAGPGVRAHKSRWWPKRFVHHGAAHAILAKHCGSNPAPPGCPSGHFWPNAAAARVVQRGWRKEHLQKKAAIRKRQPRVNVQAKVFQRLCVARLCLFLECDNFTVQNVICNYLSHGLRIFLSTTSFRKCGFLSCGVDLIFS